MVYVKEALDFRKSNLGDSHPDTLESIISMGELFYAQGKFNVIMSWIQLLLIYK